jgi:dUTP pyrophosphatase
MLPVKIKKLSDKAVIPSYADPGSAGMDLTATSMKAFFEGRIGYVEYGTDLAIEIPPGFVGLLYPRSSISSNTTFILANSVGVIDSSYRGEIKFRFKSITPVGKMYEVGDRIGQIIIVPYPEVQFEEVTELSDTSRGSGGYGSSGK